MKLKTKDRRAWRQILKRRKRGHDPILVLNMSIFNSGNGWEQIFSPWRVRENVR